MRAAVVVIYRDDELDRWHPLRILVGEIGAGQAVSRIRLQPFSLAAVTSLAARHGASPEELFRKTRGNPFFVTEVLAAGSPGVPPTVRDAVLARAARLSLAACELLEAVAIAPSHAELWLLDTLIEGASGRLEECVAGGMLTVQAGAVSFRHELARQAVEAAIGEHRRASLHRAALAALAGEPDLARLAHHADAAGDDNAVLRYAPAAAAHAAKLGAHREAASLYARTLRVAAAMPLPVRARLLEGLANECFLTTQFEAAADAMRQALDCYIELGDELRAGNALRWLSHLVWQTGVLAEAREIALRAVAALEPLGPAWQLVTAYCQVAQLLLADEDPAGAAAWAARAAELADRIRDKRAAIDARRTAGWVEFFTGQPGSLDKLEQCIGLYEAAGLEETRRSRAWWSRAPPARFRLHDVAEFHIGAGLAYCEGIDFDAYPLLHAQLAGQAPAGRGSLERGGADRGDLSGRALPVRAYPCPRGARAGACPARRPRSMDAARRGSGNSPEPRRELQWIAPVAIARAEAAWLEGRNDAAVAATDAAFEFSRSKNSPYTTGLAYWRWRAGRCRPKSRYARRSLLAGDGRGVGRGQPSHGPRSAVPMSLRSRCQRWR